MPGYSGQPGHPPRDDLRRRSELFSCEQAKKSSIYIDAEFRRIQPVTVSTSKVLAFAGFHLRQSFHPVFYSLLVQGNGSPCTILGAMHIRAVELSKVCAR